MSINTEEPLFKTCPMCNAQWESLEAFLEDQNLSFNGYQANFGILDEGLFFFTHNTQDCGSTMALSVGCFGVLYTGKKYPDSKLLSKDCPGLCKDPNNFDRCQRKCECAYAREISEKLNMTMNRHIPAMASEANPHAEAGLMMAGAVQSY